MSRPHLPVLTTALVAVNLIAFDVGLSVETYGLVPKNPTAISMLTSMFLHTGAMHLVCNMVFLAVFGTLVERSIGHLRFLALYLAAGIGGALVHVLVNPSSLAPLVGASGAVCGLLAVGAVLKPRLLVLVVPIVALNVWRAFAENGGDVSFGAHIGGFVVGAMFVMIGWVREQTSLEAV